MIINQYDYEYRYRCGYFTQAQIIKLANRYPDPHEVFLVMDFLNYWIANEQSGRWVLSDGSEAYLNINDLNHTELIVVEPTTTHIWDLTNEDELWLVNWLVIELSDRLQFG